MSTPCLKVSIFTFQKTHVLIKIVTLVTAPIKEKEEEGKTIAR